MSKEWEDYKKASRESTYAGLKALQEESKQRLLRSSGDAFAKHILTGDRKKKK